MMAKQATKNAKREEFAELLRELFQLNQPELDFGIYRIMHARKDDINRFIEQDLPRIVEEAFKDFQSEDKVLLQEELQKARKAAEDAGFDPEASPRVQELKEKIDGALNLSREEGEVYDALITFFNRYYDEGDFISRRVYKDGTYAIPYSGEEVVLHWANKDQYYIKSSETLRDYSFRLDPDNETDPMRVHFRLVDAEPGAKDNNKEADESKRVFVLDVDRPWEEVEGEQGLELNLRFHYRTATMDDWTPGAKKGATAAAAKKPPTQDHLRQIAVERVLAEGSDLSDKWKTPLARPYVKVDGDQADYSVLQGQLNRYTKKNTFDYFIHKDLGAFLTRELEFYIKNELLRWEDVAALKTQPARLAPLLSKIEVIRTIGEKIIAFLAQLEEFQKRLWLKKKLVTEVNYCITLDRLEGHTGLLNEIFENEKQRAQWKELYALDLAGLDKDFGDLSWEDLLCKPEYRYLTVDTSFFDTDAKASIVSAIDDLDEQCVGVLVHSENSQALRSLGAKYNNRVKSIYIDPPYNTDSSEIIYKNGYRSSSWASMVASPLATSRSLLSSDGIICATIDDEQQKELSFLLDEQFGRSNHLGNLTIRINPSGRITLRGFAQSHEYAIFYGASEESEISKLPRSDQQLERFNQQDEIGVFEWRNFRREGSSSERMSRPRRHFPIYVQGDSFRIPSLRWDDAAKSYEVLDSPRDGEVAIWPVDSQGSERVWRWSIDRIENDAREIVPKVNSRGVLQIYYKYRPNKQGVLPQTVWTDKKYSATEYGTSVLKSLFNRRNEFSFPKSLYAVEDCVKIMLKGDSPSLILDYFAGSGTTGHAVLNINRTTGVDNKFILVEMGGYFNTVLLPRVLKAAYSKEWKGGEPVRDQQSGFGGLSSILKYVRLESYEDSLANIEINRSSSQRELLNSESEQDHVAREKYLLNYMLDVETRGSASLLNVREFVDPANYQLKVRNPTGDETKLVNVDLLETFNWLLGLKVEYIAAPIHFDATLEQGDYGRWEATVKRQDDGRWWFRTVEGTNPKGQSVLVVWRNLPSVIDGENDGLVKDNAVLDAVLIDKLKVRLTESLDDEFDILYVNGDNNISIPKKRSGGLMEARVKLIEEDFHRLMFSTETH